MSVGLLALAWVAQAHAGGAPTVALYTMGPGDDVFSRFGHAAACVFDQKHPEGRCYNYGTADFSSPGPLTWAVLQGRAEFWLSVTPHPRMIAAYKRQDRALFRQDLPLGDAEARELAQRLEMDARPELRRFIYHHFEDNCATRLRDHIDAVSGGALRKATEVYRGDDLRGSVREGFAGDKRVLVLSELLLGRVLDVPRTRWEAMFLPRAMRREVEAHFGVAPEVEYARRGPPPQGEPGAAPWAMLILALSIGVPAVLVVSISAPDALAGRVAASVALGAVALVGLPVVALAVVSSEPELWFNEVLLVLLPTDVVLMGLVGAARRRVLAARGAMLGGVVVLSLVGVLIQPLWGPLALAVAALAPSAALARRETRDRDEGC